MKHVYERLAKLIKSIFATPKRRYITIAILVALAVIISITVALVTLNKGKEDVKSDSTESYDNIPITDIVDDETTTMNGTDEPETSETTDDSTGDTSAEISDTIAETTETENSEVTETDPIENPAPTDPSTNSVQTDPTPVDTIPEEYYEPAPVETTTQAVQNTPKPTETTTKKAETETQPKPVETTNMEPVKVPVEDETYDNVYEIIIG